MAEKTLTEKEEQALELGAKIKRGDVTISMRQTRKSFSVQYTKAGKRISEHEAEDFLGWRA